MPSRLARGSEPNPNRGPLREFLNGTTARFETLADLREAMVVDDSAIVDALASRIRKTREAVLFKANPDEVIAPKQQELNLEKARLLAAERHPDLADVLPDLVSQVYGSVIALSVADQQKQFPKTRITDPEILLARPEEWDFGDPARPL